MTSLLTNTVPADVPTFRLSFSADFSNLYNPVDLDAALKSGMLDKCSTLVREVVKMPTKIISEHRESLTDKPEKS
jgi:hypothetical protein